MNEKKKLQPKVRFREFTGENAPDWEQRKLGEVVERVTRKNHNLISTLPLTISAQFGLVDQTTFFKKQVASKDVSGYYLLKNGEFAYNKSYSKDYPWGTIKRLDLYDMGVLSTLYILFKPVLINSDFLVAYYETDYWHKEVAIRSAEGARNHGLLNITARDFFDTRLIIPENNIEQKQIGHFFETLDKLITLHQRKLEQLEQLKNTLLSKMFPKSGTNIPEIRFSGFTDAWKQRKLREISERVRGNDGRMELPTLTISASEGWLDQRDRFSSNIAGKEQKNYTLLKRGELSYNHGNSKLAKYGVVYSLKGYEEALVPRVYHSFKVKGNNSDFIEYIFATKRPDKELGKLVSSGARMDGLLNINYDDFMGIKINIPIVEEQTRISYLLRKLDFLITLHQRNLDNLKNMKQTLLNKMFV